MTYVVNKIVIENVGMHDVIPRVQLELIVDSIPIIMEPSKTISNPYDFKTMLETEIHDDRHQLAISPVPQSDHYVLSCAHCNYRQEVKPASSALPGF